MSAPYTAPEPHTDVGEDMVGLARAVVEGRTVRAADRTNMLALAEEVLRLNVVREDRAAEVRLRGEQRVAELEREASRP